MPSKISKEFQPNWTSAPGATIADVIAERKVSRVELAEYLGCTASFVDDLLSGEATITSDIAEKLEKAVGSTAKFWLARESKYREDLVRLHGDNAEVEDHWIRSLPLSDMIRFGWLSPRNSETQRATCLRFFGVSTLEEWNFKYESKITAVAFRTTAAFETNPASVAAWLRKGEIEAQALDCSDWNRVSFEASLPEMRKLSRQRSPKLFLPELRRLCAGSGVALVVVRAPTGCRASGAARFVGKRQAIIQLSLRYRTDDHLWFSFFHEAGHLVMHEKLGMFLDGMDGETTKEEIEANQFARNVLLPADQMRELLSLPHTYRALLRFALRAGISAGIAVGQLQHEKKIHRSWLNRAKRTIDWEDVGV